MHPIVMVANFSGNVGKTTLTKNLLVPNMPGVRVFAVEDVNAGYNQGEAVQLSAEQTQALLEQVIEASFSSAVIVDVGASNVSNFFAALSNYDQIQEFIARVVVPTEPSEKVQADTLSTLQFLVDNLGFDADKVSLILNKTPAKVPVDALFASLTERAAALGVFKAGSVPESETFQIAAGLGSSIHELAAMDPKKLLADAHAKAALGGDSKDGVRVLLAAASAKKLKVILDAIFAELSLPRDDV